MGNVELIMPVIKPTESANVLLTVHHLSSGDDYEFVCSVSDRNAYRMTITVPDADTLPFGTYEYKLVDGVSEEVFGMGMMTIGNQTTVKPTAYEADNKRQIYEP